MSADAPRGRDDASDERVPHDVNALGEQDAHTPPESSSLSLDDYQLGAARTINSALGIDHRLLDAAAGLAEEAGEALSLVRKHVMQNRPLDRDAVVRELGDALWCIAVAADALNVPLSHVARVNEAKLRARHPNGFSAT